MDKQIITFSANEQHLHKTGGLDIFATKTVSYIEAHFDLGQNWSGYDSVEAVWWNDYVRPVRTVLDTEGICIVPPEVLTKKGEVYVNLVGVISSGNTLTDRLTTHPITALTNKFNAQLGEGTTTPLTPSEYEQFVASVKADADRAEDAKDDAREYAGNALSSAQNALVSETNASTSETNAHTSEVNARASELNAETYKDQAQTYAQNADISATNAENAKDEAIDARDEILGMSATATTLPAGSDATASYSGGVLSLGIPKGDKGDKGNTGDTGAPAGFGSVTATVDDTIGTPSVEVTASGADTAKNFDFAFHNLKGEKGDKGDTGDVSYADLKSLLPMDTASGAIVSIPDGQPVIPVESLKVLLEPIQSGTGTPSPDNIRPISGHTEVDTHRTGVNVLDGNAFADSIVANVSGATKDSVNKTVSYSAQYIRGVELFDKFKPNTQYTIILKGNGYPNIGIVYTDGTEQALSQLSGGYRAETSNASKSIKCLRGVWSSGSTTLYYDECGVFEGVLTADQFEPYNGDTYHTDLGRTVYGGTLDIVSGELVVDRAMVDLGTLNWNKTTQSGVVVFYCTLDNGIQNEAQSVCSIYPTVTRQSDFLSSDKVGRHYGSSEYNFSRFAIHDSTYDNAESSAFKTAMSGVQLCYELATPTTIQLTPTEVKLLLGNNTIWSDGDVAIVYSADVTKWIEKQLS